MLRPLCRLALCRQRLLGALEQRQGPKEPEVEVSRAILLLLLVLTLLLLAQLCMLPQNGSRALPL